jgi:predicted MPP superfamily phosphohydrolase
LRVLVGLAGTQLGLRLASRTRRRVGPLTVQAEVEFAPRGGVQLDVPPAGSARLRTHRGPLKVTAVAAAVDLAAAQDLASAPAGGKRADRELRELTAAARADAKSFAAHLAARSAVAGVGGAAALAAVSLGRPRDVLAAAATGAAALAAAGAAAAATLDRNAWREPELDGLLRHAPLVLGDLQTAPGRIGQYREQLADLVRTGLAVHRRVAELPAPPPEDAIRLLHVSDIHLSPIAFPLIEAVAAAYQVDAVVDTGDLVDWGTPVEAGFADQIAALRVPYVFIKGNHDSEAIVAAVRRQPNATVLTAESEPAEVAGLTFAGLPDPRFTPDKTTGDDNARHKPRRAARAYAALLNGTHVDVMLVHSPDAARPLAAHANLLLAGDVHDRFVRTHKAATLLVQGSTGGAGLRGVQSDPPAPFMLSVIYVDRETKRLWGVDEVTLGGLGRTDVSVRRRTALQLTGRA